MKQREGMNKECNICPFCGNVAMSSIRKAFISPTKMYSCISCGLHISVKTGNTITFAFLSVFAIKSISALIGSDFYAFVIYSPFLLFYYSKRFPFIKYE